METDEKPKIIKISVEDTVSVRDSFETKTFTGSVKKFIAHIIGGWHPSIRSDLSPDGVYKERIVDRANDRYKERVVDARSGRIIRDVDGKLTDHK